MIRLNAQDVTRCEVCRQVAFVTCGICGASFCNRHAAGHSHWDPFEKQGDRMYA